MISSIACLVVRGQRQPPGVLSCRRYLALRAAAKNRRAGDTRHKLEGEEESEEESEEKDK